MTSFSRIFGQSWKVKFHKVKLLKFKTLNFDLKFCWNWSFFHYEKTMRFKKSPQLPGPGRTRAWHHHGSDTPTSPRAIYVLKSEKFPNIFGGSVPHKHLGPQISPCSFKLGELMHKLRRNSTTVIYFWECHSENNQVQTFKI